MEREQWRGIVRGLKRLPRWWPRGAVYDNRAVIAVLLWAALHDRPISWACRRSSWPMQAWRRVLPDQSTLSRRLRDPRVVEDLRRLLAIVQRDRGPIRGPLIVDGKGLTVSGVSADPDARVGWAGGRHARGYKLHALIDASRRLLAFDVRPMNEAECTCARGLVARATAEWRVPRGTIVLGDASYDSNPLHAAASGAGLWLLAPRRRPGMHVCKNRWHHPGRLASISFTERDARWKELRTTVRTTIERYFGALTSVGGGLGPLPAWARRAHRVERWVGAKLVLYATRQAARNPVAA